MLTFLTVLKSGGEFKPEHVMALKRMVDKYTTIPHRFVCLSDIELECETIKLRHNWKGWWSKIELFREDVVTGKSLYLDLDTVIVGNLDIVENLTFDFAMMDVNPERKDFIGNSGVMFFGRPQVHVYEKFKRTPNDFIRFHETRKKDRYIGDQAFISDCFMNVDKIHNQLPNLIRSYRHNNCQYGFPKNTSIICFGGFHRPWNSSGWVKDYYEIRET